MPEGLYMRDTIIILHSSFTRNLNLPNLFADKSLDFSVKIELYADEMVKIFVSNYLGISRKSREKLFTNTIRKYIVH